MLFVCWLSGTWGFSVNQLTPEPEVIVCGFVFFLTLLILSGLRFPNLTGDFISWVCARLVQD